jgi:hypothetical protein
MSAGVAASGGGIDSALVFVLRLWPLAPTFAAHSVMIPKIALQ